MRRFRFIPACLVFLLAACNEQLLEPGLNPAETGEVRVSLSADTRHEIIGVKSSSEEEIPVDDFWVEIFTSGKTRIYCKKYAEAKADVLNLNTGDYRLLAKHGDSLGVGFNHAFYMADETFTVEAKKGNSVSATAKLSNVKAKVEFGDNIVNSNFYGDCYALLKNSSKKVKSALKFKKDETRAGYIPAGELTLEVYAKIDGELKYYSFEPATYAPNDFVTFKVEAGHREGDLLITIKVDNTVNVTEETVEIPAEQAYPADAPVLTVKSFDSEGNYNVVEGMENIDADLEIEVKAEGVMQSMVLDIPSDYIAAPGLPASIDLLNVDKETEELLDNAGFVWFANKSRTLGVVDFEGVAAAMANAKCDGSFDEKSSSFTLTVTDENGKTNVETVNIKWEIGMKSSVSVEDYDVWATKIVNPTVTFTKGDPKDAILKYRQNDGEWASVGRPVSISGNTAVFPAVTGLEPGTPCQFMVAFKDRFFPRGEGAATTETAAQLGNSGFEEWTTQVHNYKTKLIWTSNVKRDWYRPWANQNDSWWDVNSQKTLVDETSPEYQWGKCVPTVYYSTDKVVGSYSAQLISTCVCWGANDWGIGTGNQIKAAGEIFIGTSDADGNHASEGHAFPSRPSSLTFQYKYVQHQDDQFHVYMYVADSEGNIIASKDFVGGTATEGGWTNMTIPFDYTVFNKKAAKIYVCFRSTELADADIKYEKKNITVLGEGKGYVGSQLFLDDLVLNY